MEINNTNKVNMVTIIYLNLMDVMSIEIIDTALIWFLFININYKNDAIVL